MGAATWFTLRYGRLSRPFMSLLGLGPGRSGIAVDETSVVVQMGSWGFEGRAPRTSLESARALGDGVSVLSRGVHGWRGDWLVNGAGDGLVELRFEPPLRARTLGLPLRVHRLRISVDDPEGLVAALTGGARGG